MITHLILFCILSPEQLPMLHPSWLLFVAGSLCEQLDAEIMDSALAEQVVKNLLYVSSAFPHSESAYHVSEPKSQRRIEEAKKMLGAKERDLKKEAQNLDSDDGAIGEDDEDLPTNGALMTEDHVDGSGASWALTLLFRRLEKVALRVQPIQVRTANTLWIFTAENMIL